MDQLFYRSGVIQNQSKIKVGNIKTFLQEWIDTLWLEQRRRLHRGNVNLIHFEIKIIYSWRQNICIHEGGVLKTYAPLMFFISIFLKKENFEWNAQHWQLLLQNGKNRKIFTQGELAAPTSKWQKGERCLLVQNCLWWSLWMERLTKRGFRFTLGKLKRRVCDGPSQTTFQFECNVCSKHFTFPFVGSEEMFIIFYLAPLEYWLLSGWFGS